MARVGKSTAESGAATGGDAPRPEGPNEDSVIESLLFSSDSPLSPARIVDIIGDGCTPGSVHQAVQRLNQKYTETDGSFRIDEIAKGFQMLTLPAFAPWILRMNGAKADSRLSPAALETLAVVAYRQPALRADIEAIRGVAVGDVLVRLRDMNLVRIVGRAEEIGRPLLYGTTPRFLEVFGLASLNDLPKIDKIDDLSSNRFPPLKLFDAESIPSAPQVD